MQLSKSGVVSLHVKNMLDGMSKMGQIRHVSNPLHRKLKSRAASKFSLLSDYVLRKMKHIAEWPTLAELEDRACMNRSSIER